MTHLAPIVRPRRAAPVRAALAMVAASALVAACAGTPLPPVPEPIRTPPAGDLQLVEARQDPSRHLGAPVRWGGTVVQVDRDGQRGNARIEVLERRLDEDGRPLPGSPSDGRFVIFAAPAVDPEQYRRGADVTVAGTLRPAVEGLVGDTIERLPVVEVESFRRWQPRYPPYPDYYDPWYADPWYGPRVRFGVGVGHFHGHPGYRGRYGHPW